ncbi:MAG: MBL fold metallo-hydrolase [Oscillospiraceae bacterium]|jgi:metallo-beta-lactamase family protein|nr:MBL fold metallo-hydrolase [Oscillospiraceae bacterium]
MKLSFYGAAREVTGSCHCIEACGAKIFVDCGLPQGAGTDVPPTFPIPAGNVNFVLLTHAHIDHAGRLPLLKKLGFRGKIYATGATCDLASIMLRDSAHIQESDAEWQNRKAKRSGRPEVEPLYRLADAEAVIKDFVPCEYEQVVTLAPGLTACWRDIGHLLGSACIELFINENGVKRKVVFSGDVGNVNQPLLRDPVMIGEADYVITEATYGDRLHAPQPDYAAELASVVQRTLDRGGNVVIPAFAVGRTQEMLYFFRHIKERGLVRGHKGLPVYVDSPLANEATTVFMRHEDACYDEDAQALLRAGVNPIGFQGLRLSLTADDSKAINASKEPSVIISASGMCDAGRIRHHLKHNLWRKESTVVFTGYQAEGTVGRALLEGASSLKLFGETVDVKAEVVMLSGISGHADRAQLLTWAGGFNPAPKRIFVVHGESAVCDSYAALLESELGCAATVPDYGCAWDLAEGREVEAGLPRPVPRRKAGSPAYANLLAVQQRLAALVGGAGGWANRDLNRLTDQITSLCAKWES